MNTPLRILMIGVVMLLSERGSVSSPAGTEGAMEVTTLQSVLVEASAGTPWQILSLPEYVVLSRCPDDFNKAYVQGLDRATRARLALLPAKYWGHRVTPMNLVLYDRPPKAGDALGLSNPVDLTWASEQGAIQGTKSIRRAHPVLVGDGDLFISCGNYWNIRSDLRDLSVDPDSELRLKNHAPHFPAWFLTGMHGAFGLYSNRIIEPADVTDILILPNALWLSAAETVTLQEKIKQQRRKKKVLPTPALIPLDEFFQPTARSQSAELWDSEAALFVRWGLFGKTTDGRETRTGFLRLIEEASLEPITETLFHACLGLSFRDAERCLRDYFPAALTETLRIPVPRSDSPTSAFGEATPSEVACVVGAWARMEARSLGAQYFELKQASFERADRLFERERKKENRTPAFLVEFGLYAAQQGRDTEAREALEAAIAIGPIRPRARVELARLQLNAAMPTAPAGIGDLEETVFKRILQLLDTAREQMPELAATYAVWAQVLEHAPFRPTLNDLKGLREAAENFPDDSALVYKIATMYRRLGYTEEGAAIALRALPFANSEKGRSQLMTLQGR